LLRQPEAVVVDVGPTDLHDVHTALAGVEVEQEALTQPSSQIIERGLYLLQFPLSPEQRDLQVQVPVRPTDQAINNRFSKLRPNVRVE
jgi:hypothetical protein